VALAARPGDPYVLPDAKEVIARHYPLSRPLYVYVRATALSRPAVQEFVTFYLRRSDLVAYAKFIPLTSFQQRKEQIKLEKAIAGP
jgi:phosphate transport system substrate-binding protein